MEIAVTDGTRKAGAIQWPLVAILVVHALLLGWSAARLSPTPDEVGSLAAGMNHWHEGRFDLYRVNPPLVRMVATLPLVLLGLDVENSRAASSDLGRREYAIGARFIRTHGPRAATYFVIARLVCIPFSLVGAIVCYFWARQLYGQASAYVASALWCFSPNVLGHGQLFTTDMPATAMGVAAAYTFWRWCARPTWNRAVLAGVVLGVALLTKTTWIILTALLPLIWLMTMWLKRRRDHDTGDWRDAVKLLGILVIALYVLNLGYGFEGSFKRLEQYTFISTPLAGDEARVAGGHGGNRFAETWIGNLPMPVPWNYLRGLDLQKWELEREHWSYLAGTWRHEGWWYYYLYGLAVKVPAGTWLLVLVATVARLRLPRFANAHFQELFLLAPATLVVLLASYETNQNHHVRYVFPVLPFGFIWASQAARYRTPIAKGVTTVAIAASIACSLWTYPHALSYFNALSGGPLAGHRHLVSSNIDWGQDLLYLKRWLDKHPQAASARIAVHGGIVDPKDLGIDESRVPLGPVPGMNATHQQLLNLGPQPGWYIINVGRLRHHSQGFSYFRLLEPEARIGYSIHAYHITPTEANHIRRRLNLPEI